MTGARNINDSDTISLSEECIDVSPSTVPSSQLSFAEDKESSQETPSGSPSSVSGQEDNRPAPACTKKWWRLSAQTKSDVIQCILVVPPLAIAYIFGIIDRDSMTIVQELADDGTFPFQGRRLRILETIYYVGMVTFAVPSILAAQKLKSRQWLPPLAVAGGVLTLLPAFVNKYASLLIVRFITGVTFAGTLPYVAVALVGLFDDTRMVMPLSLVTSGGPGLASLQVPIANRIHSDRDSIGTAKGWQAIFLIVGITTIATSVASFFMMHDALFHNDHIKAIRQAQLSSSNVKRPFSYASYTRHWSVGMILSLVISLLDEAITKLTPLAQPSSAAIFSNVHQWDYVPDSLSSVLTVLGAIVIYQKPHWLTSGILIASVLSVLGATILLPVTVINNAAGQYVARNIIKISTQAQIPLIYVLLTRRAGQCQMTYRQLAILLAAPNIGFGLGGILGVWESALPPVSGMATVLVCAVCSMVLFGAFAFLDRGGSQQHYIEGQAV